MNYISLTRLIVLRFSPNDCSGTSDYVSLRFDRDYVLSKLFRDYVPSDLTGIMSHGNFLTRHSAHLLRSGFASPLTYSHGIAADGRLPFYQGGKWSGDHYGCQGAI